jgi:hypothetical protein
MKTKAQIISELKLEYPTLTKQINGEVLSLSNEEYELTISNWADNKLEKLVKEAETLAKTQAKAALLSRLGITEEQAKLLLS